MPSDTQYTEIIQRDKCRIQTNNLKVSHLKDLLILSHQFLIIILQYILL